MIPVIRRITALKHTAERAIGVGSALIRALRIFVSDPGVNDDAALAVIAKEQPILLEELRPEPVLVLIGERCALSILGVGRVLRYDLEGELYDGGQPLGGVLGGVPLRILGRRSTCATGDSKVSRNCGCAKIDQPLMTKGESAAALVICPRVGAAYLSQP